MTAAVLPFHPKRQGLPCGSGINPNVMGGPACGDPNTRLYPAGWRCTTHRPSTPKAVAS